MRRAARALCAGLVLATAPAASAQVAQNPSPMSDTTRPHPRMAQARVAGSRAALTLGELYISDRFGRRARAPLVVHFHGASYRLEGDPAAPRVADPAVDTAGLEVFTRFAADAAAGRRQFWLTHSEVYPGTFASTTETANVLLASLGLARRPVLKRGPIGMQQLSEASRGGFRVAGFAGNSAPDHADHLYALGDWLREWKVIR